jgi:hypothetical protein
VRCAADCRLVSMHRIALIACRRSNVCGKYFINRPKFWRNAAANQLDPIPESVVMSG